jgi:hypothetical protein
LIFDGRVGELEESFCDGDWVDYAETGYIIMNTILNYFPRLLRAIKSLSGLLVRSGNAYLFFVVVEVERMKASGREMDVANTLLFY